MKIEELSFQSYNFSLINGQIRKAIFIQIKSETGKISRGDIAPLPKWSRETLEECELQLHHMRSEILKIDWTQENIFEEIKRLRLLPSISFGLESALLSLLAPLTEYNVTTSALLMGSLEEIFKQAEARHAEGYTSAKLKVNNLSFDEAALAIQIVKDRFALRIDVNRAWTTKKSLEFFKQFPIDAFDYVEEPFEDPEDLALFSHPLAVDESFPQDLSLKDLESLPQLKALIYKPTIQGGLHACLPLHAWAKNHGIELVLSSCFESDLGLSQIVAMAHRLRLKSRIGIGTKHFLIS